MRSIIIPFSGFYNTLHDAIIDVAVEGLFTTDNGNVEMPDDFYMAVSFKPVFVAYSRIYVDRFVDWLESEHNLDIPLVYEELSSPCFYNFETDRIFCHISEWDIWKLYCRADREELRELVRQRFTSYDGFISHYDNDLDEWPRNVLEWDCNQLGTLLECIVGEFDEWGIMEDCNCNGEISDIIMDNINQEAKELYENFLNTHFA